MLVLHILQNLRLAIGGMVSQWVANRKTTIDNISNVFLKSYCILNHVPTWTLVMLREM